jgi:histidine triad (HIT) family protein
MNDCLFCKMASGEIEPDVVYADEELMAFRDIHPQAPFHLLIIPRAHITNLNDLSDLTLAGKLLQSAAKLAEQFGYAETGYRTVLNTNKDGGQSVYHLHLHVLAGRQLSWPPG